MQRYIKTTDLNNYDYDLPDEAIAQLPLSQQGKSKLLFYNEGKIKHLKFKDIVNALPDGACMAFNDTKVFPARIKVQKKTGANIEIFLIKPYQCMDYQMAMNSTRSITWQCMIGNKKRWKANEELSQIVKINSANEKIKISYVDFDNNVVKFIWSSEFSFGEILNSLGLTPIPPYIKRNPTSEDKIRYQTVYSKHVGAVAAPTAGLHFTSDIIKELSKKGIEKEFITLHVGAGTFLPIKEENFTHHTMHNEQICFSKQNILNLLDKKHIISVGTTSLRALESLFWYGVLLQRDFQAEFKIEKLYPYQHSEVLLPNKKESFEMVIRKMEKEGIDTLIGATEIFIFPSYKFRVCDGLITNFHLPRSTLLLLIAAFVGDDWKEIYRQALVNGYRFLSYGDASLLMKL